MLMHHDRMQISFGSRAWKAQMHVNVVRRFGAKMYCFPPCSTCWWHYTNPVFLHNLKGYERRRVSGASLPGQKPTRMTDLAFSSQVCKKQPPHTRECGANLRNKHFSVGCTKASQSPLKPFESFNQQRRPRCVGIHLCLAARHSGDWHHRLIHTKSKARERQTGR